MGHKLIGYLLIIILVMGIIGVFPQRQHIAQSQDDFDVSDYRTTMIRMLGAVNDARLGGGNRAVFDAVINSGDPLYIAPLIDLAFFTRGTTIGSSDVGTAIFEGIQLLSNQDFGNSWENYFQWAGEQDIPLPPSYDEFKGLLFSSLIDPNFERFFRPGTLDTTQINLVEVVWGGVMVDGIPSLVNARQITPEEANAEGESLTRFCSGEDCSYPSTNELVFGVSINGDNRAYPLRLLNWHEMFNDIIGHAPLYEEPNGEAICNFRAPVEFHAIARLGDDWVQINGDSAGCTSEGNWLETTNIDWMIHDWESVRNRLPDIDADEAALEQGGVLGRVDGTPVMLAYCTLCGAGILYDTTIPDLIVNGESRGATVLEFGSTGLLMRSNKLMYDRTTNTVWNALTGEPAFGPLAESGLRLPILPVVVTDWATWLEEHPDTSVLSLDTGYRRDYTNGAAYGDYFNNPNFIMFPVWQQDTESQTNKEMIFALNISETPKAYPLRLLIPEQVTNDTLAGQNIVIIAHQTPDRSFFEPGGAAVRAYDRGHHTFAVGESDSVVVDEAGIVWEITEDVLASPDGETLGRLGGHLAYWFGWYAYYPDTLVYGETE